MISLRSFQLVALTETEQHCSEITYLLFKSYCWWLPCTLFEIFLFSFVIILLNDCMLFNKLILFSKRKKKSYFLFVCSCIMVNPLWSALMNNCLVIFLETRKYKAIWAFWLFLEKKSLLYIYIFSAKQTYGTLKYQTCFHGSDFSKVQILRL